MSCELLVGIDASISIQVSYMGNAFACIATKKAEFIFFCRIPVASRRRLPCAFKLYTHNVDISSNILDANTHTEQS